LRHIREKHPRAIGPNGCRLKKDEAHCHESDRSKTDRVESLDIDHLKGGDEGYVKVEAVKKVGRPKKKKHWKQPKLALTIPVEPLPTETQTNLAGILRFHHQDRDESDTSLNQHESQVS